jgi:hypothetical protein
MNKVILTAAVTFVAAPLVRAQMPNQAPEAEFSRVQLANASPLAVKLTLMGEVVADAWPAGGQLARGPKATLKWGATFEAGSPLAELKESIEIAPGQSGAALLVGDFAKVSADEASGPMPGYTKLNDRTLLRASLLKFPIGKQSAKEYPVYLVNGDPESTVKVSVVGGRSFDLEYGKPADFKAPVGAATKLKVVAKGGGRETNVLPEPYERGIIIAFYRPKDSEEVQMTCMILYSIESPQERSKLPEQSGE